MSRERAGQKGAVDENRAALPKNEVEQERVVESIMRFHDARLRAAFEWQEQYRGKASAAEKAYSFALRQSEAWEQFALQLVNASPEIVARVLDRWGKRTQTP